MPGTHLLPPNLLKLFAPRPPLPYTRPLDRDIDRARPKNVDGVGQLLAQLHEEKTQEMMNSSEGEGMEEGEEPNFTYAEETKRQIRREERKKKKTEEFRVAKDSCALYSVVVLLYGPLTRVHFRQACGRPRGYWRSVQDPLHRSSCTYFLRTTYISNKEN